MSVQEICGRSAPDETKSQALRHSQLTKRFLHAHWSSKYCGQGLDFFKLPGRNAEANLNNRAASTKTNPSFI